MAFSMKIVRLSPKIRLSFMLGLSRLMQIPNFAEHLFFSMETQAMSDQGFLTLMCWSKDSILMFSSWPTEDMETVKVNHPRKD